MISHTWERCGAQPDYCRSVACIQLWRVRLCGNEHGDLYGYAEETREWWILDGLDRKRVKRKPTDKHPPQRWVKALAGLWGVVLPEAQS